MGQSALDSRQRPRALEGAMPSAWGVGMTRHPKLGAVERRTALSVNWKTGDRRDVSGFLIAGVGYSLSDT